MTERIETPRGAIVKTGEFTAELQWKPGFASQANARYNNVQEYVDSEVLRLSDPYISLRTSMLKKSGILGTVIGSGTVQWIAPYARKQYYRVGSIGSATGPLRGPQWFKRMKNDHGAQIINGAKKLAGGGA